MDGQREGRMEGRTEGRREGGREREERRKGEGVFVKMENQKYISGLSSPGMTKDPNIHTERPLSLDCTTVSKSVLSFTPQPLEV